MSISTEFITRPIATTLLTLGLLIFGGAAFFLLPVAALPEVEFPTIQISANLPGASPETMANSVASPLERQLATIQGVSQITSTSSTGSTQVTVQFVLNRSIDAAAQDVSAAINAARGRLPADLPDPPQYKKVNPADTPVLLYGLTSEYLPDYEVSKYADILAQQLSTQPGVSQVTIGGEQKFAVRVDVNPTALASRGIGIDEVANAITQTNLNRPKGQLQGDTKSFQLDANDQLTDAKQFGDVLVAYRNGAPVKVSDVARVYNGVENDKVRGFFNGKPGILPADHAPDRRQRGRDGGRDQRTHAVADPVDSADHRDGADRGSVGVGAFGDPRSRNHAADHHRLGDRHDPALPAQHHRDDHSRHRRAAVLGRHVRGHVCVRLQPQQPDLDGPGDRGRAGGRRRDRDAGEHRPPRRTWREAL